MRKLKSGNSRLIFCPCTDRNIELPELNVYCAFAHSGEFARTPAARALQPSLPVFERSIDLGLETSGKR